MVYDSTRLSAQIPQNGKCPNCGYCKECGRSDSHPLPYTLPYQTYPTPFIGDSIPYKYEITCTQGIGINPQIEANYCSGQIQSATGRTAYN